MELITKPDHRGHRVTSDIIDFCPDCLAELAGQIDKEFCTCADAYKQIGRIDPYCQSHDIADFIVDWTEKNVERLKR